MRNPKLKRSTEGREAVEHLVEALTGLHRIDYRDQFGAAEHVGRAKALIGLALVKMGVGPPTEQSISRACEAAGKARKRGVEFKYRVVAYVPAPGKGKR